uniref:uncharacterized protein LOC131129811 n=1 Tax=Doryrhamphus excisus TaxID=161450 RepID=UPI0025AE7B51|nr:uncharacterized protein LOC131129811 [Doryrhamphus excisus]
MLLRVPASPPFCSTEQKTFRENAFCIASDKDKDKGPKFDGNCSLPLCWTSSADIEMPRKKGFRMRRTPRAAQAVDCAVATKGREEVSSLSPVEVPTGGLQKVVKGSFHQGNTRFKYAGTQCMAIAFCATALHSIKNVLLWDTADLDMAVVEGDQLYTTLRERHVIRDTSHFFQSMVPLVSPFKYLKRKRALDKKCKYVADMCIRETKKLMTMKNCREQAVFRQRKKMSVEKYRNYVIHKNRVKTSSIYKYRNDSLHRDRVKMCSVSKYRSDSLHRDRVKMQSIKKYKMDTRHRASVKLASMKKYLSNVEHKMRVIADVKARRHAAKLPEEEFDVVVEQIL